MQATAKIQAAADIIRTEAVEAVAKKNGITAEAVLAAIAAGNPGAIRQFAAFVQAGVAAAIALHEQQAISLV